MSKEIAVRKNSVDYTVMIDPDPACIDENIYTVQVINQTALSEAVETQTTSGAVGYVSNPMRCTDAMQLFENVKRANNPMSYMRAVVARS